VRSESSSAASADGLVTSAPNRAQGARTTSPTTGSTISARADSAGTHSTPGNPVWTVCGSLVWATLRSGGLTERLCSAEAGGGKLLLRRGAMDEGDERLR
jgi:hypothetical protein